MWRSRALARVATGVRTQAPGPVLAYRRVMLIRGFHGSIPRYNEKSSTTNGATNAADTDPETETETVLCKVDPQLMLAFTCKVCNTRSSHTLSKQGYEKGSVLIQCPGCKNRHLIADNLHIFRDNNFNLEQVLKLQGDSFSTDVGDLVFEDLESLKAAMEKVNEDQVRHLPPKKE